MNWASDKTEVSEFFGWILPRIREAEDKLEKRIPFKGYTLKSEPGSPVSCGGASHGEHICGDSREVTFI